VVHGAQDGDVVAVPLIDVRPSRRGVDADVVEWSSRRRESRWVTRPRNAGGT
jgi:hypothetical protein